MSERQNQEIGTDEIISSEHGLRRNRVRVEGEDIDITYKLFLPQNGLLEPGKLRVFFTGWSMGGVQKSGRRINQALADYPATKSRPDKPGIATISISTRPVNILSESLLKEVDATRVFLMEAEATRRLIPEIADEENIKQISEVTVSGHSEG